jgi:hypothetical protein
VFEFSLVGKGEVKSASSMRDASILIAWIGVIVVASIFAVVFAANWLDDSGTFPPEIVLPLIVIVGVVALLATLAITAATFGLFGIADKGEALGLPAGSVQAVIALGLILIFAVVALYASSSSASKEFTSTGLSAAEVKAIPAEEILAKEVETPAKGAPPTYKITRRVQDEALKDLNTQLLTTVSTLVIAVAGFYFGSKSVQEGSKAAIEAAGPNRSLTITPASPCIIDSDKTLDVHVQSVPPGAQLNWVLHDDPDGHLLRRQGGDFVYEPGAEMLNSDKSATLVFEQVEDPSTSAILLVNFPKGKKIEPSAPMEPEPDRESEPERPAPVEPPAEAPDKPDEPA